MASLVFELECAAYFLRSCGSAARREAPSKILHAIEFSGGGVYLIARPKNKNENSGQITCGGKKPRRSAYAPNGTGSNYGEAVDRHSCRGRVSSMLGKCGSQGSDGGFFPDTPDAKRALWRFLLSRVHAL